MADVNDCATSGLLAVGLAECADAAQVAWAFNCAKARTRYLWRTLLPVFRLSAEAKKILGGDYCVEVAVGADDGGEVAIIHECGADGDA